MSGSLEQRDDRLIRVGMIMEPSRFILDRFTVASTKPLIQAILDRYDCEVITNQDEYDRHAPRVDVLFSLEPGFAAPKLDFRRRVLGIPRFSPPLSYVMMSDPHKDHWRQRYVLDNGIDFILALYRNPTLRHFTEVPSERVVHFPWVIPDSWIDADAPIVCRHQEFIGCFGAAKGAAYDMRNWCKSHDFVLSSNRSRCEGTAMGPRDYMQWLSEHDAVIAAGSSDPIFDLTTPKYYEIAASGALLFAQETQDLAVLGFEHMKNCVVFTKESFVERARAYLNDPERYLPIREAGRQLVLDRHVLSKRLAWFDEHIRAHQHAAVASR